MSNPKPDDYIVELEERLRDFDAREKRLLRRVQKLEEQSEEFRKGWIWLSKLVGAIARFIKMPDSLMGFGGEQDASKK
jgi:signal transduction protein with GAF and PtsI domain